MPEGLGNTSACLGEQSTPSENLFSLRRLAQNGPPVLIEANFSAPQSVDGSTSQAPPRSNLPVFNRDARHFTPSFVLKDDYVRPILFRLSSRPTWKYAWSTTSARSRNSPTKRADSYLLSYLACSQALSG